MITVGLDFGTHQTKVCIEDSEGVEINYSFMKFEDTYHSEFYTLPSVVGVDKKGLMHYGFLNRDFDGRIVKYFKQSAFDANASYIMPQINAWYFSAWYIAFIIFDLEKKYGQQFAIQMGAPTDSSHVEQAKEITTRIVSSAYRLVEDVFKNDKQRFLSTTMKELVEMTVIVPYSIETKNDYGLLVFPEAYACLMPLISQGKLESGMNLMIDIGGGTTDISFFTIENNKPQVYAFYSLNKGLNFLTHADEVRHSGIHSNLAKTAKIDQKRKFFFMKDIKHVCGIIRTELFKNLEETDVQSWKLKQSLKKRPLIYSGGGSTFNSLRNPYDAYVDIILISERQWNGSAIEEFDDITDKKLCPILATAYGLSVSATNDDIVMKPLSEIFAKLRVQNNSSHKVFDSGDKLSLYSDWDTLK